MTDYSLKQPTTEEVLPIEKLVKLLENKASAKVVYLDIVSVEREIGTPYYVQWFAKDKDTLKQYHDTVKSFFQNKNHKSLLSLKPKPPKENAPLGVDSRVIHFSDISSCISGCIINTQEYLETTFTNNHIEFIDESDEDNHTNNWKAEVLSKMCVSSAVFAKIDFTIDKRNFVAAIWIGFDGPTDRNLFECDYNLKPHIKNFLWAYSSKSIAGKLLKDLHHAATRAAIAQVMARNTGHNIGAHVMNKLIDSKALREWKKSENYISGIPLDSDIDIFDHIANFNNYVKCRMEYLADISFGTPLMQTNKYAYENLFKDLDKAQLLLEYISGLGENFKFEIKFKYNSQDMSDAIDLLVAIPNDILGMQAFYNILENIIRNTAKHAKVKPKDKITFTINFVDNINPDYFATNISTDIETEIENILNDYIAVEVYDNVPIPDDPKKGLTDAEKKEYHCRLAENKSACQNDPANIECVTEIDWLVYSQNKKINDDILVQNQLRSDSLGVIEMDASAAYLRKRDVGHINHENYNVLYDDSWSKPSILDDGNTELRGTKCRNFLKAFKTKNTVSVEINNSEKPNEKKTITGPALGYRFFLLRPEVVLVVTDIENIDTQKITNLKKQGICVASPDEFEKHLKGENGKPGKVYNHEFVVYEESKKKIATLIQDYKTSLPLRVLKLTENKPITDLFSEDAPKKAAQTFEKVCWEKVEDILKKKYPCEDTKYPHFSVSGSFNAYACHSIVLLDHLYSGQGERKSKDEVSKEWENHKNKDYYVEALSSKAQARMPDFWNTVSKANNKSSVKTENFKYYLSEISGIEKHRIVEAALAKVIVIDERIQNATKKDFSGVLYKDLYSRTNVLIPELPSDGTEGVDLSANVFDSSACKKIKKDVWKTLKGLKPDDFILIHYSILERIYGKKEDINHVINKLATHINVVITSGRGIPDGLSSNARFVNLSSAISAFVDFRSKHQIFYLLSSSRKTKS